MNRYYLILIFLILLILFPLTSCSNNGEPLQQSEPEEEFEVKTEETSLSEEDFAPNIGTLPYRGAVLFINYEGEVDLSDYVLHVDISHDKDITQENMPVEEVDGNLAATIVDLMYIPGDELEFLIKIYDEEEKKMELHYSETLKRYPWKDWIFEIDQIFTYDNLEHPIHHIFKYDYPDAGNQLGVHASWDFYTQDRSAKVYANTTGIFYIVTPDPENADLTIYNPYTGAIIQFGHCNPLEHIRAGNVVAVGEQIANVQSKWGHVHYSVYRPYQYVNEPAAVVLGVDTYSFIPPTKWEGYYWPMPYDDHGLYNDPFYWHEPTVLGYWYEDALPEGLYDGLIEVFKRENPDVIIPAREPLRE